jgi:hypothetical protein
VNWEGAKEPFRGISDWRLHLALLCVASALLYALIW